MNKRIWTEANQKAAERDAAERPKPDVVRRMLSNIDDAARVQQHKAITGDQDYTGAVIDMEYVRGYRDGMSLKVPDAMTAEYVKAAGQLKLEADPEWNQYLKLKAKFEKEA